MHVSSKFNSPAVSRYHPVEGEAYAAAWALNKCKLFVLGNPDLLLAVDHKPLLAILGNENELNEVLNPRLLNFKLKSMAYKFKPVYVPGKKHVVPDSFSRRHDSPVTKQEQLPKLPPTVSNVLYLMSLLLVRQIGSTHQKYQQLKQIGNFNTSQLLQYLCLQ